MAFGNVLMMLMMIRYSNSIIVMVLYLMHLEYVQVFKNCIIDVSISSKRIGIYQQLQIVGDISVEVSAPKKVQD